MYKKISYGSSPLILALLLSACGGSGSDPFSPPSIPSTPITITQDNQYEVAIAAESGIEGGVGGSTVIGVVVNSEGNKVSALEYTTSTVFNVAATVASKGRLSLLPAGISFTVNCDISGSLTGSTNVDIGNTDAPVFFAGDSFTLSFNNCKDFENGSTTNGSITITVVSGTFDLSAESFTGSVSVSFNNLRDTENGETFVMHGGMTLSQNGSMETVSGESFYALVTGGEAIHLTDFNISSMVSGSTETTYGTMTIAGTEINGSITISIDSADPVVQGIFASHAHSGTIVITGGATTQLTMEFLDTTRVMLTLDSDSDGTPDADYPVTVTWTEIEAGSATIQ